MLVEFLSTDEEYQEAQRNIRGHCGKGGSHDIRAGHSLRRQWLRLDEPLYATFIEDKNMTRRHILMGLRGSHCLACRSLAAAAAPDFSGSWVRDASKSKSRAVPDLTMWEAHQDQRPAEACAGGGGGRAGGPGGRGPAVAAIMTIQQDASQPDGNRSPQARYISTNWMANPPQVKWIPKWRKPPSAHPGRRISW